MGRPTLTEVYGGIWRLHFDTIYDLSMHFLRYQENYESPNPRFRGRQFSVLDFMEWYSKAFGSGSFTYVSDWGGFNVPSEVLDRVLQGPIPDESRYDYAMRAVRDSCRMRSGPKFYLIGTFGKGRALDHEIAHGKYYLDQEYRSAMNSAIGAMSKSAYRKLSRYLTKIGYDESVMADEVQAYMATGLPKVLKKDPIFRKEPGAFRSVFREFVTRPPL